jgi:hypothetical protein
MRIEILVDNEDPQIFPLNKPKMVIGSHESCDIILQTDGVSRKHLIVVSEDDSYFAIDQGSTNGSYINEERLVPGRKVEFTSFFPLRLGDNVLVTLLSDEDANDLGFTEPVDRQDPTSPKIDTSSFSDATRTISLKDLQSAKTDKLQKKRHETVVKRKQNIVIPVAKKREDKSRMFWVKVFCVALVGAATYYNFFVLEPDVTVVAPPVSKVGEIIPPSGPPKPKYPIVDKLDFTSKERLTDIEKGLACTSDIEKYLCDMFPAEGNGAIQSGTMIHVYLNGSDYYQKAIELIPKFKPLVPDSPNPIKVKKYQDDLLLTAIVLFLQYKVPKDFNYERLKGLNLTLILKLKINDSIEYVPVVFVPDSLNQFMQAIDPKNLEMAKRFGADALYGLKDYYQTY